MSTRFEQFAAHYAANFSQKYFKNAVDGEMVLWQQFANNLNIDLDKLFEEVLKEHGSRLGNPSLPLFKRVAGRLEREKLNRAVFTGECGLCDGGWMYFVGHVCEDKKTGIKRVEPGVGDGYPTDAVIKCRCSLGSRVSKEYADPDVQRKVSDMIVDMKNKTHSGLTLSMLWNSMLDKMCKKYQAEQRQKTEAYVEAKKKEREARAEKKAEAQEDLTVDDLEDVSELAEMGIEL